MSEVWYYAEQRDPKGPFSLDQLKAVLARLPDAADVLVWQAGFQAWKKAKEIPELAAQTTKPPPLPPEPSESAPNLKSGVTKAPAAPPKSRSSTEGIALSIIGMIVGIVLVLFSEGVMAKSSDAELVIGIAARSLAAGLFFSLLHWRKWGLPKSIKKSIRSLGWTLIVFGAILIGAFGFLQWAFGFSAPTDLYPFVVPAYGLLLITIGVGLIMQKAWAPPATRVVAFLMFFAWPIGFALALYAWWVLTPSRPDEALPARR